MSVTVVVTHIYVSVNYIRRRNRKRSDLYWVVEVAVCWPDACPSGNREDQGRSSKRAPREALTNQYCLKSKERQEYVGESALSFHLPLTFFRMNSASMLPSKTSGPPRRSCRVSSLQSTPRLGERTRQGTGQDLRTPRGALHRSRCPALR